ncbi:hypothetical protein HEK616_14370 [Streptomyces nigrescens]|uniref:Small hydrophilic protein n=2 Tax=Streptomyces TaxID=1883 RepID=A0ABN6QRJ3_STRNI|nr:hypothetical protein [Streptomyces nigrescens]MEE4423979.1 hypothetical protein [Streptomyces sp. DSM 41528]BDM67950.1 hypothetical protein HEK616_14370 [Streptomyces nigrescens]
MAKDKKQNRSQKAASPAERGQQAAQKSSMEAQTKSVTATPGDLARKNRERRFGHN